MSDDLGRLIEAVEAGTLDAYDCGRYGRFLAPYCNGETIFITLPLDAYNGSVDAAIVLLEALLPGWWAEISIVGRFNHAMVEEAGGGETAYADNMPSPARALLLAVLRAKLMEMENE